MLKIVATNNFKKDIEKYQKRGYDLSLLDEVVMKLANEEKLDKKYRDHSLKGDYSQYRECHVKPDWLLIYTIDNDYLELILFRTGTHSDLFK